MAEAAAVIGLISSIASLIEISVKVVSRVGEYGERAADVPKTFRSLADRLPLLSQTLKRIQPRAQARLLTNDVAKDLDVLVKSILDQVKLVDQYLDGVVPAAGASRFDRVLIGLKSLAKDEKVKEAVEKIHHGIDVLVLHQTTSAVEVSDHILQELSRLSVQSPAPQQGVSALKPQHVFGLRLGQAPLIEQDAFLGRQAEIQLLHEWLSPSPPQNTITQTVVSIVGLGGLGKTQLSLAYAREYGHQYSSVFWLNAKSKAALQQSMSALTAIIFPDDAVASADVDEQSVRVERVRSWLSEASNTKWLIIFDNYDDPSLPNIPSQTGFDIRQFFPTRTQGSILITTRSTKLTFSKSLKLQKLQGLDISIAVLSQRSGQDLKKDRDSRQLATRLDGFPLALAMAGTYLAQTAATCTEYLDLYETAWYDLHGPDAEELMEYEGRTLSSTWTISLDHVRRLNADAAELLYFLGYLNNDDIWYELIKAGADSGPPWMARLTASKIRFDRAMSKLGDYSLVEVKGGGAYRVHPCLHDWISGSLPLNETFFVAAIVCLESLILSRQDPQYWAVSRRLMSHVDRIRHRIFKPLWDSCASNKSVWAAAHWFGDLYRNLCELDSSEEMYERALAGKEKALGPDDGSTLDTINSLGLLYIEQGKIAKAETVLGQALTRKEEVLGQDSISTLDTGNNLGIVYRHQGKLNQAEQLYKLVLAGLEKKLGQEHISVLETVNNLALVYLDRGNIADAETTLAKTLAIQERTLGRDHALTLDTLNNLGIVYRHQGKLDQAEKMYKRVLTGLEEKLGREHVSVFETVGNLGLVYMDQGKLAEAEVTLQRALDGTEKKLGRGHSATLLATTNLAIVYRLHDKPDQAEALFESVLVADHVDYDSHNSEPHQVAAYGLLALWTHALPTSVSDPVSTQNLVARLIQHVKVWFKGDRDFLYLLGRALLRVKDDENGSIAYCHRLSNGNVICDGCNRRLTVGAVCYACRSCDDIDLCEECMGKVAAGDPFQVKCEDHEFCKISLAVMQRFEAGNEPDIGTWLVQLEKKYPPQI